MIRCLWCACQATLMYCFCRFALLFTAIGYGILCRGGCKAVKEAEAEARRQGIFSTWREMYLMYLVGEDH